MGQDDVSFSEWFSSVAQKIAAALLLGAIVAVYSAVSTVDHISIQVSQIERRVNSLEEFRNVGRRFTADDGDKHAARLKELERWKEIHSKRGEVGFYKIDRLEAEVFGDRQGRKKYPGNTDP